MELIDFINITSSTWPLIFPVKYKISRDFVDLSARDDQMVHLQLCILIDMLTTLVTHCFIIILNTGITPTIL